MTPNTVDISKRLGIAIAVNEMVKTKSFDDLRVRDICDSMGISRSSFYRLFEDKYEIARWCHYLVFRMGICEIGRTLDVRQGNIVSLNGLRLFGSVLSSAAHEQGENTFRSLIMKRHSESMWETLEKFKGQVVDDELSFQIRLTAESQANIVALWLDGAYSYDAQHLVELMVSCFPQRLFDLLNEPVTPEDPVEITYSSIVMHAHKYF